MKILCKVLFFSENLNGFNRTNHKLLRLLKLTKRSTVWWREIEGVFHFVKNCYWRESGVDCLRIKQYSLKHDLLIDDSVEKFQQ